MKRKNYLVTSDAGHHVIKHAWNSAIRETAALTLAAARQERTTYELVESVSNRDPDGWDFANGARTWRRTDGGKAIKYTIERQA